MTCPCSVCGADVDISDMPFIRPGTNVRIWCSDACNEADHAGMWKAPDDEPKRPAQPREN